MQSAPRVDQRERSRRFASGADFQSECVRHKIWDALDKGKDVAEVRRKGEATWIPTCGYRRLLRDFLFPDWASSRRETVELVHRDITPLESIAELTDRVAIAVP
jgi:hypothetical protein